MKNNLFLNAMATFSECKKHRFDLWRVWNPGGKCATFILLNPSADDEWQNDPTVLPGVRIMQSVGGMVGFTS